MGLYEASKIISGNVLNVCDLHIIYETCHHYLGDVLIAYLPKTAEP